MSMPPIPWRPSRETLSEFSEAWMFVLGMILAPRELYRGNLRWAVAFWILAVAGRGLGLIRPSWLRPIFLGLTLLTWPVGWVISNLVLVIMYYGVIVPLGLGMKLLGRDALKRRRDPGLPTYWETDPGGREPSRYFQPF